MAYEHVLVETKGPVCLITLHRPEALNALCEALMTELFAAVDAFEADEALRVLVLTGSERAFAAGADIKEMAGQSYAEAYRTNFITRNWERVATCRKPVIAAVSGYALGGGCELAMMADFIIAADTAKFGQPEITLGILPGAGGTQRLTRALGKAKAMEMCLTGRLMDAAEAERSGLVARVVPASDLTQEALRCANVIARQSQPAAMMVKEAVALAFETTLTQGLHAERRLFHASFALDDQKEGMAAFVEKRKPRFSDR